MIESINNQKVINWNKLKMKKYRDITNTFLVEGNHLLNEALKNNMVKEIIATDKKYEVANIPFYLVNFEVMKKLSSQVSPSPVIAVCQKLSEKLLGNRICILDDIQDPGNLGTIIRSAIAFNIDTIVVSLNTVDIYNEKVLRATEGMIFNINIIKKDLNPVILELKNNGYKIYGTDVVKGYNLRDLTFPLKLAIVIGNEGSGINTNITNLIDENINIKINNNCESLNASVAASIIFYEVNK